MCTKLWREKKRDAVQKLPKQNIHPKPITYVRICYSFSSSFHFGLMRMLYTELFYKKALHIFWFQKKERQRTEAHITATHVTTRITWKLGITLFPSHSCFCFSLFHISHLRESAMCWKNRGGKIKQEMRMHINISKRRVTNGEDLLQDVYFFINMKIYTFIYIHNILTWQRNGN